MPETPDMQFERVEFQDAPAQAACAECQTPLAGFYYEVNGRTVCERCRYAIESRFSSGSAAGRFLRAAGFGLVAAALGSLLYYGISALTGYEFGLIAIVVGFMVGAAVSRGSNGRGGWVYQTLAIALTYFAIVSTYIPPILASIREQGRAEATVEQAAQQEPQAETEAPGMAMAVAALLALVVIACAAPFLAGFQNIIGLVIIGIGLYEAWKLNRRATLTISGPHALAARRPEGAGA